jgi:hypothetical protein
LRFSFVTGKPGKSRKPDSPAHHQTAHQSQVTIAIRLNAAAIVSLGCFAFWQSCPLKNRTERRRFAVSTMGERQSRQITHGEFDASNPLSG